MSLTNNAFSNTSIDVGSTIGKKVAKISVINPLKQQVNIKQLSGDQGLIILFFGSADWCSFCKKHLIALNNQAEKFITLDYGLVVISYDNTDILKSFYWAKKYKLPITL